MRRYYTEFTINEFEPYLGVSQLMRDILLYRILPYLNVILNPKLEFPKAFDTDST